MHFPANLRHFLRVQKISSFGSSQRWNSLHRKLKSTKKRETIYTRCHVWDERLWCVLHISSCCPSGARRKRQLKQSRCLLAAVRLEWRNHMMTWNTGMKVAMLIQTHIWMQEFPNTRPKNAPDLFCREQMTCKKVLLMDITKCYSHIIFINLTTTSAWR